MGRSSYRVAGAVLGTVLLAPIAGGPVAAAPAPVPAHSGTAQGMGRPALPRMQRAGAGIGGRRVPRYGYGDGYLGAAGAGLATAGFAGDGYPGDYAEGYGQLPPGAVAPPEPPPIAPLPACPMIIKIGPGLDHPVQTRVIYGASACR